MIDKNTDKEDAEVMSTTGFVFTSKYRDGTDQQRFVIIADSEEDLAEHAESLARIADSADGVIDATERKEITVGVTMDAAKSLVATLVNGDDL